MPGKKITDQQVRKYKEARRQATQQIAAARMGISVRSARRIEQVDGLPSQRGPRTWRTRADPLADVWEQELVPLLEREPGLQGRTLLEELQRRHGEVFGDGVLRTLQRRIRMWRAEHGHEKEVFFSQANPPGRSRRRSARSSWSGTLKPLCFQGGRVATTCAWCGMWRIARCVAATCRYGMAGLAGSTGWSGAVTRSPGNTFSALIGGCRRGTGCKVDGNSGSADAAGGTPLPLRPHSTRLLM